MKCPRCSAENAEASNFCSQCDALLVPQLARLLGALVEEYVRERFKDQKVVDVETTEAIAERFLKWSKLFLIPATALVTLSGLTLGVIGFHEYTDVHKAAQEAIERARVATARAQEAQNSASGAIQLVDAAKAKMNTQLASASQLSVRVSELESKTAGQIANASKHVEGRIGELDKQMEDAKKEIATQQGKLASTRELVTAMLSGSRVETFPTSQGNTPIFVADTTGFSRGAFVFLLLNSVPVYATVEVVGLKEHQQLPSSAQFVLNANVLRFVWEEPPENLKQHSLEVSYVADPTYHGVIFSQLSIKDGHVFADNLKLR